MIFSISYRLVCCLMVMTRREASKDADLLVLRHENALLRRQVGRVPYLWGATIVLGSVTCADRRLSVIGNDDHLCLCVCST
jgi:putative transposase